MANVVTDDDVRIAAAAYVADPKLTIFLFGDGYTVDIVKVVEAHEWAFIVVSSDETADDLKRIFVRTAILRARPVKA